ncbi:MAG: hypothetical protein K9L79_04195 [Methylobacter tundripaludum]|nr:hypothetical protein [Methylobacter tundripaludum]
MPICRLCRQNQQLRYSHIIPEFLYANLYNNKGHMMGINGRGAKGWRPLQQGIREYLFCESCEQHFNEYCEKPFRAQWILNCPLPDPWNVPEPHWISVEYKSFKLFHLSVLFRASVSSLPTFSEVNLGPHEEKIRTMILNRDAGEYWQYPVFGLALLHHKTNAIIQMVSQAMQGRFVGLRCYTIVYGGVQWWVAVASHRSPELESVCLQADGRLPLGALPWNELNLIKLASELLRDTQT